MNQIQKLTLQCILLIMSYTYALRMNPAAAVLVGGGVVLLSVEAHSPSCLVRRYPLIMCVFLVLMGPLSLSGLSETMPVLPFLVLVSVIFAVLWMESSVKVLRPMARAGMYLYAACLSILLIGGRSTFGIAGSIFEGHYSYYFLFLSLLFLPLPSAFAYKTVFRKKVRRYLQASVKKQHQHAAASGQI